MPTVTKYLLDTTALIDYLRGRREMVELLAGMADSGHELGVCSINVAELYSGLNEKHRTVAGKLVDSLEYWEATHDTARIAGMYRFDYARKGITLATTDALVAAIAVSRGAVLVTSNARHYPMKELQLLPQP